MNDDLEGRRLRLAQTIAWCGLQKLENRPFESEDVKRRRALGSQAVNLAFAAHQLEASSPFKWVSRGKVSSMQREASLLLDEARLDTIRPLAEQLRTPALKPAAGFETAQNDDARAEMVEAVCRARAALLSEAGHNPASTAITLGGGRILRYTPCGKIADGSPGYDSKGFFDWECSPPWDTWIYWAGGCVIAYVPRILCGLAQLGNEVDPADCLRWADTVFVTQTFGQIDP